MMSTLSCFCFIALLMVFGLTSNSVQSKRIAATATATKTAKCSTEIMTEVNNINGTSSYCSIEPECACDKTCINVSHEQSIIKECLSKCGFVIIENAYNVTTLKEIYNVFFKKLNEKERFYYVGRFGHLRGKRIEYIVPFDLLSNINGFEQIIYNELIVESSLNFLKEQIKFESKKYDLLLQRYEHFGDINKIKDEPFVLDAFTIIDAPGNEDGGDVAQGFHRDAPFGIKVQIPLIDVKAINGPTELIPFSHKDKLCPSVFGTVKRGSVIIYQQNVSHRGTKNHHWKHRPVIDMSYMAESHHFEDAYMINNFQNRHRQQMAKHQRVFVKHCQQSNNCPGSIRTFELPSERRPTFNWKKR